MMAGPIKVTADKQEDGTWTGTYLITEIGKAQPVAITGYPPGNFSTHEEAEAAALHVAQQLIDSRDNRR